MIVLCRQSLKRSVEHGDSQVCECLHIQSHRSHLSVGEVEVVTHFHRQRSPAAAAEVHDAVLAASMRHVVDCEHSLTRRVPLRKTKGKKKAWVYTRKKYSTKRFMIFPTLNWVGQCFAMVCCVSACVCSHHYESEVVSVGVAVVRALDLQFVASHSADLHLVDQPGDTQ